MSFGPAAVPASLGPRGGQGGPARPALVASSLAGGTVVAMQRCWPQQRSCSSRRHCRGHWCGLELTAALTPRVRVPRRCSNTQHHPGAQLKRCCASSLPWVWPAPQAQTSALCLQPFVAVGPFPPGPTPSGTVVDGSAPSRYGMIPIRSVSARYSVWLDSLTLMPRPADPPWAEFGLPTWQCQGTVEDAEAERRMSPYCAGILCFRL